MTSSGLHCGHVYTIKSEYKQFTERTGGVKRSYLRPYLDIFKAPGSPCHELSSGDNSTSMRI